MIVQIFKFFAVLFSVVLGGFVILYLSGIDTRLKPAKKTDPIETFIQTKKNFPKNEIPILAEDIRACSKISQISPSVILAMIETESDFNPDAIGLDGELNIMQVHPEFWNDAERGFISGCEKLIYFNIRENKNLYRALVSWNAGSVKKRQGKNKIPGQNFAVKILKRSPEIEALYSVNSFGGK